MTAHNTASSEIAGGHRPPLQQLFCWLFLLVQLQRHRIDAVSQAGRPGSIRKHMPEVCSAFTAHDFSPAHAVGVVCFGFDILFGDWLVKAGPAGSGLIFGIGVEQLVAACGALIYAGLFGLVILAREWTFRPFHSAHLKLLGRQLLFPFLVGLLNFVFHLAIVLQSVERRLPVGGRCSPNTHGVIRPPGLKWQ
jgi:hypothetical protein